MEPLTSKLFCAIHLLLIWTVGAGILQVQPVPPAPHGMPQQSEKEYDNLLRKMNQDNLTDYYYEDSEYFNAPGAKLTMQKVPSPPSGMPKFNDADYDYNQLLNEASNADKKKTSQIAAPIFLPNSTVKQSEEIPTPSPSTFVLGQIEDPTNETVYDNNLLFFLDESRPRRAYLTTTTTEQDQNVTEQMFQTEIPTFQNDSVDYQMSIEHPNKTFPSESGTFIFNPFAEPAERFQECRTPKREMGFCIYPQHCPFPNLVGTFDFLLGYVCIIKGTYVGVCCPENPIEEIVVNWVSKKVSIDETTKSSLPTEGCGLRSVGRIVGGKEANPKDWTWMVALVHNNQFFCGGSLISNMYVLTAAHCTFRIPNNEITVRIGGYDVRQPVDPVHDIPVAIIKRHAQFSRISLGNDIALLKLAHPVQFSKSVGTICLAKTGVQYSGKNATLVGWGNVAFGGPVSEILQEASFPVWTHDECEKALRTKMSNTSICAGSRTGTQGACNGDSGGPLMLFDDNKWTTIGIVSWGRIGCNTRYPVAFTNIASYLEWIMMHAV